MSESGIEYIKRRMSKRSGHHISSLRKLHRAQRKAKQIAAGNMSGDDTAVDTFNEAMYREADDNKKQTHVKILHATKGIRRFSKRREIFYGANQAHMWKIIQHNMRCHATGKLDDIIR